MDNQFRTRILMPILLLLGPVAAIALVAFSVSRILLAVPELTATFIALLLAAYVLFIAVMVGKRGSISGRTLGAGAAVGLIALLGAGLVSAQAGTRELHHFGDDHGDEAPADEAEGTETAGGDGLVDEIPEDALLWVAVDVDFSEEVTSAPAGEHIIAIDNQGTLPHNVVIQGVGRVDADGGQKAIATVTLEPGTYEYVCDIPGHAGTMSGTLEVD
jgi:plastocyanin